MARTCAHRGCAHTTDHASGYCSDTCLQADMAPEDLPPVTVLAPNKAGGFGLGVHRMVRQALHLPQDGPGRLDRRGEAA